jgi:hypothetical protein
MPSFEINIKTTDDVTGLQNATEETIKLTDAMGKLLERAKRKEEYAAAKEAIAGMTKEEQEAALAAYKLEAAQDQANAAIAETGTRAQGATGMIGNLKASWMEMYGAIGVVQEVIGAGQAIFAATVGEFMDLADKTRELQQAIGATAEEASTLIAVADDVQISAEDIQRAFEAAIKRGVDPSIEGLASLSEQFQRIQDPVAQTRFLMETFGRTGADLHRLLALDAEKLRELQEEAQRTGQVLTDEQMKMAEQYRQAVDGMGDAWGQVKREAAITILPTITDIINASLKYNDALKEENGLLLRIPVVGAAYAAWLGIQEGKTRQAASAQDELNKKMEATAASMERLYNRQGAINPGDADYRALQVWMMEGGLASEFPGRAAGGPVQAGQAYTINENRPWTGPEVFLAPADGYIYPSTGAAARALGGGGTPVLVDYHPTIGLGDRYEAEQILIPLIEQALRKVQR